MRTAIYKFKEILYTTFHSRFTLKLFLAFMILIAVPLTIFTGYCFSLISSEADRKFQYSAESTLSQTTSYLNDQIASYKNTINVISYDSALQTVLANPDSYMRESQGNWIIPGGSTGNIMYTMTSSNVIKDIRVYPLQGNDAFENSSAYIALSESEQQTWQEYFSQLDTMHYLWVSPSTFSSSKSLSRLQLFKKIPSTTKLFSFIGLIQVTFSDNAFSNILRQASLTENTSVILYNRNYEIIDSHIKNETFQTEDLSPLTNLINDSKEFGIQRIEYGGTSYLTGISSIENTDWSLLLLIPTADTMASNQIYLRQMILVFLLLILLLFPVLIITSHTLSSGIQSLNEHLTRAMKNRERSIPLYHKSDEVGELTSKFNELLTQMNDLLDEQYRSGYALKGLELQVLQEQINPHFLYNTLDMIYWLSLDYPDSKIPDIARELGSFYRLSLGHGESVVTIQDELQHIKAYTAIQNIRFDNKIKLEIQVPDELLSHSIIKLVLQPLVENAILHGIREKATESGTITVTGSIVQHEILLTVTDDGVGMSNEQIQVLLSPPTQNSGYAVWNVDERLKLNYGSSSGLHFITEKNQGTTVEIRIPL